jgi:hypothetical protein
MTKMIKIFDEPLTLSVKWDLVFALEWMKDSYQPMAYHFPNPNILHLA